jgi:hypothetical protein
MIRFQDCRRFLGALEWTCDLVPSSSGKRALDESEGVVGATHGSSLEFQKIRRFMRRTCRCSPRAYRLLAQAGPARSELALSETEIFKYNGARKADSGGAGAARTRVSPLATGEMTTSDTQTPPQLPHHKVKIKKTGQRACNEKNEKGKFCGGHLKRWFYTTDVIEQACGDAEKAWGKNAEVYRCEHCKTLYLPSPEDAKVNVAGKGRISVFGLTLPPKEK